MAQLTAQEFDQLIVLLADHYGLHRFHERLLKVNALVSRKRPAKVQALANQLYQLSAGLRREHPARYAIEALWQEMFSDRMDDENNKTVETLAERVNGCLTERLDIIPEKEADLLTALGSYHQAVAALTSDEVAYIATLLRASTDVARFLREHKVEIMEGGTTAENPQTTPHEMPPEVETASET